MGSKSRSRKSRMNEGLVPYLTGKSQEDIIPKSVLKAANVVRTGMSKVYPSIKRKKREK